ncbi:hypothetical protein CALVIDRAFT_51397 [Calocera viscosa TUFC12733]|uniref:Uncharacterized protein n=1 Tax=Calocera viscosa (strain TUFC12733) TaxID=1330018 RepID=A0A167NSL2_CALVF|nr:hypothetical protein CALVIDRAFT_51397 [Calocera viscosa TUFC12733]
MGGNGFSGGGNRKVSAGSHTSDASFPTRPDATIATELPSNDNDSPPHGAPAGLPYPALAQGIGMRSQSTRGYNSSTLSLNITPSRSTSSGPLSAKKTTGFFSSIGRKGSTRRDRNLPLPNPNPLSRQTSSPLSAGLPGSDSPTRYVRPQVAPSIPGGPREPPNRLQKTNPVSRRSSLDSPPVIISAPLQTTTLDKRRSIGHSAVGQYARPLEAPRGARAYGSLDETSSQFSASLQKMADILPQANRMALARYLTDANGEEMMAITRYIDDEKRGGNQF